MREQATATGAILRGLDAVPVPVTAHTTRGATGIRIGGIREERGRELALRVQWAIEKNGWKLPESRFSVILAPEAEHCLDLVELPIALAVLAAAELLPAERLKHVLAAGRLWNEEVDAPLGLVQTAHVAAGENLRLATGASGRHQAAAGGPIRTHLGGTLQEVADALGAAPELLEPTTEPVGASGEMDESKGSEDVRNALAVAVAGGHASLIRETPGMTTAWLVKSAAGLAGPLGGRERHELLAIQSAAGLLPRDQPIRPRRPFRAPHHTVSVVSMEGREQGGRCRPGEVSLAHAGVLYLDQVDEFERAALNGVNGAVRYGVAMTRNHRMAARCVVIASSACTGANGPWNHDHHPLQDLFDVRTEGPETTRRLPAGWLRRGTHGERVRAARQRQKERYGGQELNAHVNTHALPASKSDGATSLGGMSPVWAGKVLRVAQTLADLGGDSTVTKQHIDEAALYVGQ